MTTESEEAKPAEVVVVGSANVDRVVRLDRLPRPGETVLAADPRIGAGGKGANQAVALAVLGRRVSLRAAVGSDAAGSLLIDNLRRLGVETSGVRRLGEGVGTGEALILLDRKGENSIVVIEGANRRLTAADVGPIDPETAAVLVQCEVPVDAIRAALSTADSGQLRVLNPAPAGVVDVGLLELVDVLVPNRVELAQLTGARDDELDDLVGVRAALAALPVPRVVVTLGAAGALVRDGQRYELVPAPVVPVVDTTGAGDCFCAALTSALIEGADLIDATNVAVTAAALSTRAIGAQGGLPNRVEIDSFLAVRPTGTGSRTLDRRDGRRTTRPPDTPPPARRR
ncbi:ribokinase [Micromonospora sp. HUAS LYJ1]|uniref:ribokinase n=1 Tax=Micromonospora sp. HUAS LYJ1 TaxID=3061626 RepID=UPI00267247AA|nr:ribokinase [Micromonospora sp. HUAS LYJ1]WKU03357.1 ribokinase [Micromonospora sp. HUAS LYJ1]